MKILTSAEHPNIIQLFEIYETDSELLLIMELATGGEVCSSHTLYLMHGAVRTCFARLPQLNQLWGSTIVHSFTHTPVHTHSTLHRTTSQHTA